VKLIFTPNPEYVHKVLVVAHEAGVLDRIEMERQVPFDEDTEIWRYNPLGKVPAFEMDDGSPLYGGLVICEYLDSFNTTAPLFPRDETRWQALRQMITGDGVFDATTLIRVESWRPKEEWHRDYMLRERRKIMGALRHLEHDAESWTPEVFHIGHVTTAGGLSYLDLRNPIRDCDLEPGDANWEWRDDSPRLAKWLDEIRQRPSLAHKVTLPK